MLTVVNELVSVEKCGGLKKFATVLVLGDVVQIHQRIIHAAVFTTDVDVLIFCSWVLVHLLRRA